MIKQITECYINKKCVGFIEEDKIGELEKLMLKKKVFPELFSEFDSEELDSLVRSRTLNLDLLTEKITVKVQFDVKKKDLTPAEQYTVDHGIDLSSYTEEDKEEDKRIEKKDQIWKSLFEGTI